MRTITTIIAVAAIAAASLQQAAAGEHGRTRDGLRQAERHQIVSPRQLRDS
jgi:Ni/Co efflux regulator RcnB